MSDRPTPETKEAWDAVSRLPSGMYDSRVSIFAYATAMSDHSRKMERQRDELLEALESLTRHRPIMGSTGDYREGQVHILESVTRIAKAAIAAVKGGKG
jgi:hypothetical protein